MTKEAVRFVERCGTGQIHFSRGELALLEAVALQIGMAIKRMRLAEQQQNTCC
ncbi:hypothetical protein PO124_25030 [Bacillus licheniformis]|nr:hypothetical protein [Bacillus licheniformis]